MKDSEENIRDLCINELARLTGKKHIILTKRGNVSIRLALKYAKSLGYERLITQDQGGWLTYEQFAKKEKLELIELATELGVVEANNLKKFPNSILLINSMPGYAAIQDMKKAYEICKANNIFVINDASGSIGADEAKFGNMILGSFGIDKPVNVGQGGFLSADDDNARFFLIENNPEHEFDMPKLHKRLKGLKERLSMFAEAKNKLIKILDSTELAQNILFKNGRGINLIVRFKTESQKEKLIKIAEESGIEHTVCPRKIRVLEKAVCFEIKRLQQE